MYYVLQISKPLSLFFATMEEATMEEALIAEAPGATTFPLYIPDFLVQKYSLSGVGPHVGGLEL
jgi:hypothetical protein